MLDTNIHTVTLYCYNLLNNYLSTLLYTNYYNYLRLRTTRIRN